ncbi:tripartite tricarboxylate transporter TctB family protein [Hydrogenophaga sp. YM1]|uniref:tripartite tricarboxylate transporter TctB family protein n=1 Tax=Hydrogenophaga sp. YM1 TaxID=2806262 RepID=UPI001EF683EA|nr:tripartite tricarboxylate transporter TctB family protein [Hydrogenophaga sp. YM1]
MASKGPYRALLLAIAIGSAAAAYAVPWLITPYDPSIPWYQSTAFFPRVALSLATMGALIELVKPHARIEGSDEIDASESNVRVALIVVATFVAYALLVPVLGLLISTAAFSVLAGLVAGLRIRTALALAIPLAIVLWVVFAKLLLVAFGGFL